jgi:hypothetical protein
MSAWTLRSASKQAPSTCTNADWHNYNGFVLPEIVPCEGWTHYAMSAEEASGRSAGAEPIFRTRDAKERTSVSCDVNLRSRLLANQPFGNIDKKP